MVEGTEFEFEDRKYVVELSGKPTCHKGEPKTDIYVLAKSSLDEKEIKISQKKENADFIENKIRINENILRKLDGKDGDAVSHRKSIINKNVYKDEI